MIPVFQTIFGANGGNCLSASIASILELNIDEVPAFVKEHGDGWEHAADKWLASRNLKFIKIGFANYNTFLDTFFDMAHEYCVLSGPSSIPGFAHAVVGQVSYGAIRMVHDPMPGSNGPLEGHRWIRFIVPMHEIRSNPTENRF